YDQRLARYPYEDIDFDQPDATIRRFRTIDYMAPDLLLNGDQFRSQEEGPAGPIREAFFELFSRLLRHEAPVAQYAALHGLGHLRHPRRAEAILAYLGDRSWMDPEHRAYAQSAIRGDIL